VKQILPSLCLCASALTASITAAHGQTPVLAWDAEASAARPAQADVYRGETVALRPAFLERGAPADTNGAAFTLYWQTNGMGAAWWSDPTNAFRWTPARDCGAAAYTLFIRCDTAAGASYRANARLRMLDSPGAEPNALPLPVPSIDFSAVIVTNAPWVTAADWASGSNALASALQPLGPRLDLLEGDTNDWQTAYGWGNHGLAGYLLPADLAPYATTQQVAEAAAAIPRDRITTLDGSQWIDATGGVWRVSYGGGGYWTISILGTLYGSATNAYYEVRSAPFDFWNYDQAFWDGDAYFRWYPDGDTGSGHVYVEVQGVEGSHDYNYPTNDLADGVFEFYTSATYTHFVLAWQSDLASVSTQRVDGLAWQSDLPLYATTQQVAQAVVAKLDAASPEAALRAEWTATVPGYDDIGHLRIYDAASDESVYIGPYGFGQWRYMDAEYYPEGVDRFVSWADVAVQADVATASNNLAGIIGALVAADIGALPAQSPEAQLRADWVATVPGYEDVGHLKIYDPLNFYENALFLGPLGFGQFTYEDPNYPAGIDRFVLWSDLSTLPDIALATNAIVDTYLLGSNAWMIVSNDVLRIWQVAPTNAAQTNLLWQSGDAFPPAATQTLWQAILQLTQDVDGKAPAAWGNYAPDGSANPDPAYMTFLNAPAAVFASGAQWSTYGTYAVLTATGTVAFAAGSDGQLRIGPNSTNWFGYVQGDSVTVGAAPGSLTVVNGGAAGGYAEIVYPYAGGDFPTLWFTPSLALDFTEVGGAVWIDNLDGTATATAPAESASGFWYATTTSVIDTYFMSTMPARLDGGVIGATNAVPVVYDSVITVTSGGKTYRIPAQEVLP